MFDHLFTTLVSDLEERGLLDDCLVIAMGEFGRTPQIGTQDSSDGRNHWPVVMSMCLAGGGFRHGQHLSFDPNNPPPLCNLYVSMLQRLGIETDRFANATGTLTGLDLA